jgi:spore coat protein U-like protein
MMKRLLALALLACTGTGAVAQVACNLSVAPLGFGVYDTLGPGANQVNGGVTLDCYLTDPNAANRIGYSISLGTGSSGSYAQRTMRRAGGSDVLGYNAYLRTPSAASIWGDGTGGTVRATGSITVTKNSGAAVRTEAMVGVIPARQPVGPGLYSDALIVTVTWN